MASPIKPILSQSQDQEALEVAEVVVVVSEVVVEVPALVPVPVPVVPVPALVVDVNHYMPSLIVQCF